MKIILNCERITLNIIKFNSFTLSKPMVKLEKLRNEKHPANSYQYRYHLEISVSYHYSNQAALPSEPAVTRVIYFNLFFFCINGEYRIHHFFWQDLFVRV